MIREPRWPNGEEIGLGIADDAICLTFGDSRGGVEVQTFGALHGRLNALALAERIRELRPSAALLFTRLDPDAGIEAGVVMGTAIGLLSALGVPVLHPPLPTTMTAPNGAALH